VTVVLPHPNYQLSGKNPPGEGEALKRRTLCDLHYTRVYGVELMMPNVESVVELCMKCKGASLAQPGEGRGFRDCQIQIGLTWPIPGTEFGDSATGLVVPSLPIIGGVAKHDGLK
jgi:hypothetical protein